MFSLLQCAVQSQVPLVSSLKTECLMSSESESENAAQFFEAVQKDDIQKVDELLSSKAVDINCRNPELANRTALHIAAHRGRYELVSLLVDKHKADVNSEDSEGVIPLQLADDRYHMKIVKFLLSRNSNKRDYAAHHLNSDEVEELFQATEENDIAKVTEIIESGVNINSEDQSNFGQTPLEIAAENGYYDLVKFLVEHGADMQHDDDTGECAYHKAVNNTYDNIANYLLEKGFRDIYATAESSSSDTDVSLNFLPN